MCSVNLCVLGIVVFCLLILYFCVGGLGVGVLYYDCGYDIFVVRMDLYFVSVWLVRCVSL